MESEDFIKIPLPSTSPGDSEDDGVGISCPWSAKRPRMTVDAQQQPSVRVIYNSLTRESRKKLDELLQQWSEWRSPHCPSTNDSNEALESGEEIYFPALNLGVEKALAVPVCIDNQGKNPANKDFIPLDGSSIPLYDRGFSAALTSVDGPNDLKSSSKVLNSSRCFNCGSYSHALRECPKPRDSLAVDKAIKEYKSGRSQNATSRNPTRYFQSTPRGKFDGLRPGFLNSETRQLLGLGELDPPPWLNRMREIGYPLGYLDSQDGDQPSGITIFADEESKEETKGKILENGPHEQPRKRSPGPSKKMSVEYPGINAPIPENADRMHWKASTLTSDSNYRKCNLSSDSFSKGYDFGTYNEAGDYQDHRPPGSYLRPCSQRYGISGNSYGPYGDFPGQRSLDRLSDSRYSSDFINRVNSSHVPDNRPPSSYLRSSFDRYGISDNPYSSYGDSSGQRNPDLLSYRRYEFSEELINRDYVSDRPPGSYLGSSLDRYSSYDYK